MIYLYFLLYMLKQDSNATRDQEWSSQDYNQDNKLPKKIFDLSRRVKVAVLSIVLGLSWQQYLKHEQNVTNTIHEWMDLVINPENTSLDQKLEALIISNDSYVYKSDYLSGVTSDSKWMVRFLKPGLIKWMNFQEAKTYIAHQKEAAWSNKLFAIDFEGGFFPNITFTRQDYESFHIPKEILDLRDQQAQRRLDDGKNTDNLNALPSQEYIWKYYLSLNAAEKQKFLWVMEQYWKGISQMLSDLGADIIFWPVVDTVPKQTYWNQDVAWNGRSFWSGQEGVGNLIVAYVKWIQSGSNTILPVYKHFIAAGIGKGDAHDGTNTVEGVRRRDIKEASPEYVWNQACSLQTSQEINTGRSSESSAQIEKKKADLQEWQRIILKLKKKIQWDKDWANINIEDQARYLKNESILTRQPKWQRLNWLDTKQKMLNRKMWNLLANAALISSENSAPIWVMTSHVMGYYWGDKPVVYDASAIQNIYKLGCKRDSSLVITDDLSMNGSDAYMKPFYKKYPQYSRDAIRIYQALSSGNDLAFKQYLHTNWNIFTDGREEIIHEITDMIKNGVDMNNDKIPDLTEGDISKKYSKFLSILARLWKIESFDNNGRQWYIFPENISRLIWDIDSWDVVRDIIFSNTIPTIRSWGTKEKINTDGKEWNRPGNGTLFLKSAESVVKWLSYLMTSDDLNKEKVIVVDKSVQTLFIIDGQSKDVIESFPISIGKWTGEKNGLYDRREFWDGKTPVWFYKFARFKNSEELHKQFWEDYSDYGGKNGWMMVLAWPWSPNIAIHGTLEKITGLQSSWCVRISNSNLENLRSMVPEGTLIVITN